MGTASLVQEMQRVAGLMQRWSDMSDVISTDHVMLTSLYFKVPFLGIGSF